MLALLFQFQESAEFQFKISPRTQRDYVKQIKRIEKAFGDFPIKALDDPNGATVWRKRRCGKPIMPMALWPAFCPGRSSVG